MKTKVNHGYNKLIKDLFKFLKRNECIKTTNNYRKMHGLPIYRRLHSKQFRLRG